MNSKPSSLQPSRYTSSTPAGWRGTQRLANTWIDHLWIDLVIAAVGGLACARTGSRLFTVTDGWSTWLQTIAGSVAAVLGLSTLSVTILFTFSNSDRLSVLRSELGADLQRQLLTCLRSFLIALGLITGLGAMDRLAHIVVFDAALGFALTLVVVRTSRLGWLFQRIIRALAAPESAPPIDESVWHPPVVQPSDYVRPVIRIGSKT